MMKNDLWSQYYSALRRGDKSTADKLLKQIKVLSKPGMRNSKLGGCSSCRRRL